MAQSSLGRLCQEGSGIAKDQKEAIFWHEKAAKQGLDESLSRLGACHYLGHGVPKNVVEAYAYLSLASASNDEARKGLTALEKETSADQVNAGKIRAKELQKEIEIETYANYFLPSKADEDSRTYMATLEKSMTAEQLNSGKKRAESLKDELFAK